MKWYVLTHIRKLFLVWVILGIVGLIVGLTLRPDLPNTLFLFYMIWVLAGHCGGNLFARSMLTQALRTLDETCDPEPLVEVSRAIVKQNPKVCGNWVYLAWALTLLGREEEALEAANRAERRPRRLWKNPLLLLIWSSALPVDDPKAARPHSPGPGCPQAGQPGDGGFPGAGKRPDRRRGTGRLHPGAGECPPGLGAVLCPAGQAGASPGAPGLCCRPRGQAEGKDGGGKAAVPPARPLIPIHPRPHGWAYACPNDHKTPTPAGVGAMPRSHEIIHPW